MNSLETKKVSVSSTTKDHNIKDNLLEEATFDEGVAEEESEDYSMDNLSFEEKAITVIKLAGFRITMPRVQVVRALSETQVALSAYEIYEAIVSAGGQIDVVSVYRILHTLQKLGLVHRIGLSNGYFPCSSDSGSTKRSVVFIEGANSNVFEMRLPTRMSKELESLISIAGFKAESIKIEVTGCSR